jgi:hypothetical protein
MTLYTSVDEERSGKRVVEGRGKRVVEGRRIGGGKAEGERYFDNCGHVSSLQRSQHPPKI